MKQFNKKLFSFLNQSPTPFHAADSLADMFEKGGFQRLNEGEEWKTTAGKGYYVIRDGGSFLGIVSLEDVLESLLGAEIVDEHDEVVAAILSGDTEQADVTFLDRNSTQHTATVSWPMP